MYAFVLLSSYHLHACSVCVCVCVCMCVSVCARVHMHIHGCACLHAYSYNNLCYLYIRTYVATSIVRIYIYFLSARYILCSFVHTFLPNSTEFAEYTFSCRAKLSFGVKFQFVYN